MFNDKSFITSVTITTTISLNNSFFLPQRRGYLQPETDLRRIAYSNLGNITYKIYSQLSLYNDDS